MTFEIVSISLTANLGFSTARTFERQNIWFVTDLMTLAGSNLSGSANPWQSLRWDSLWKRGEVTEEEIADVKGSMLDEFVDIGKLFADL